MWVACHQISSHTVCLSCVLTRATCWKTFLFLKFLFYLKKNSSDGASKQNIKICDECVLIRTFSWIKMLEMSRNKRTKKLFSCRLSLVAWQTRVIHPHAGGIRLLRAIVFLWRANLCKQVNSGVHSVHNGTRRGLKTLVSCSKPQKCILQVFTHFLHP